MVHLAVAVGDGREVEAYLRQGECRRLVLLAVPQRLHDVQPRVRVHNPGGTLHDALDLCLAEAVEELAHPDGVVVTVGRKLAPAVEQVCAEAADALCAPHLLCLLPHHLELLGQVDDGHLYLRVVGHALHGPAAGVAAHVEQRLRLALEHHLQGLVERMVAIEVVEGEPALLCLRGQLRQSLIDRRPRAEMLQARRASLLQRLFQTVHADVVHVVVEVDVDAGRRVDEQEPAGLRQAVLLRLLID